MTSSAPGLAHERLGGDASGKRGFPNCPECHSAEVRPSRSSYPKDEEKIAGAASSFWRCGTCGHRFLGPKAPERSHRSSRHTEDPLLREIASERERKRWRFPLLVIATTVVVVILVFVLRDGRMLGLRLFR